MRRGNWVKKVQAITAVMLIISQMWPMVSVVQAVSAYSEDNPVEGGGYAPPRDLPAPTVLLETSTPTPSPSPSPEPSQTETSTGDPSATPVASDTPTPADTDTPTPDAGSSETPTVAEPSTTEPTATETPTPSPTGTEEATSTPTATSTETETPTPTQSETPTATPTETPIPLSAPNAVSPVGEVDSDSPEFIWQRVEEAESYHLFVIAGEEIVVDTIIAAPDACTGSNCTLLLDAPLEERAYTWQVQALDATGQEGEWSELLAFSIILPTVAPELRVEINNASRRVAAGGDIIIDVTISNIGQTDAENIELRNALPTGLNFKIDDADPGRGKGPRVSREAVTEDLLATLALLPAGESVTVSYILSIAEPSNGEAEVVSDTLQVSASGIESPFTASLDLLVLSSNLEWGLSHKDTKTTVAGQRVQMEFPAGAFSSEGDLIVVRRGAESVNPARGHSLLSQFDLVVLSDPGRGQGSFPESAAPHQRDSRRGLSVRDASFAQPFTMTVSFDGLVNLDRLWQDRMPFVAVLDPDSGVWVRQPLTSINPGANSVTIEATHFSTWGAGIGGTFPVNGASVPLYDQARVSTFTGKSSFSYPLWVPTGRGGMQPNITLSYASGSVDGILGDVQSPWVGTGWNIDAVEITRLVLNGGCGGSCGDGMYGYENKFVLVFNGASYTLVEDPQHPGRYHTEEASYLYIQLHNTRLGNLEAGGVPPPNTTKEWWEVVTSTGTRYRLGWYQNSEQLAPMKGYTTDKAGNPVFSDGIDGGWDSNSVKAPSVIDWGDGTQQMWYNGIDASGTGYIGTAGGSGGTTWNRVSPFDPELIEAEDGARTGPMFESSDEGASNCQYVWTPENGGDDDDTGEVTLEFHLDTAGTTYIWAHVRPLYTLGNDFYYTIDDGNEVAWNIGSTYLFKWKELDNQGFYLVEGDHTITFRTKDDGSMLDAIRVTQDTDFEPLDIYCNSAPALVPGADGTWDDVRLDDPEVIIVDGVYHMWYTGYDGSKYQIGHATSPDGEHWTKDTSNPVLSPSATSGAWDNKWVAQPSVIYDGTTYHMWYGARTTANNKWRIGYTISADGVTWTNAANAITLTGWGNKHYRHPSVMEDGSGGYLMWFSGEHSNGNDIYITSFPDGLTWTAPVKLSGTWWKAGTAYAPDITYDGTTYRLWYAFKGTGNNAADIGYSSATTDEPLVAANWSDRVTASTNAWSDLGYAGEADNLIALRWRVDQVTDINNNVITYSYTELDKDINGGDEIAPNVWQETETYDRQSYLSQIIYTGSGGQACNPTNEVCYIVDFKIAPRPEGFDIPLTPVVANSPEDYELQHWDTWDTQYLTAVRVSVSDGEGGQDNLRSYEFAFSEFDRQDGDGDENAWDSIVLDSVTTVALKDSAEKMTAPRVRFDYTFFDNRASTIGEPEWGYPRLTNIHNGTEGDIAFTYGNDGRPADQYFAWRVLWKTVSDGVTSDQMRVDYEYGPACYSSEKGYCNEDDDGTLVGHEWAIEKVKDFTNALLSSTKSYFHTDEDRVGKTYQTDTRDSASVVHARSETDYAVFDHSTHPDIYPIGVRLSYVAETRQFAREGGVLTALSSTKSTYDPQWGDILSQEVFRDTGALYMRTQYSYLHNIALPDVYLHSYLRSQVTCIGVTSGQSCLSGGTLVAASYNAYDNTASGLGSVGRLTLQQSLTLLDSQNPDQTIDSTYKYDIYGNVTEARTYGSTGDRGTIPAPDDDADRFSITTYDSTFNMYPISSLQVYDMDGDGSIVVDPNAEVKVYNDGLLSSTTYDFQLGELPLGLPRESTSPNGATAKTVYDSLGRPIEVWQHGSAQANIKTIFPDVDPITFEIAAPYTVELKIWDDGGPGGDQYRSAWAFYDGLGRILRTVGAAEEAGQYIQSDVYFGPRGSAIKSATPYEVTLGSAPGTWSAPNWPALAVTQSISDDLGRVIEVIGPDGSSIQTEYDGRRTAAIDPNGHKRESLMDDLGRLIRVNEYSGTGTIADPYALYTSTNYGYDSQGRLTTVTDFDNNITAITYDAMGRKVSLNDPDMGIWLYAYDHWGQMTEQIDGRSDRLSFSYDQLGRPLTQSSCDYTTTGDCDQPIDFTDFASYTYDTAANGLGLPATTTSYRPDGNILAIDSVSYDILGRPVSAERKLDIDGDLSFSASETFTATTTFDSLGRVLSSLTPQGETLTTTYNARGLTESVFGNSTAYGAQTYISDIDYTATGAIDQQTVGNGIVTDYTYDSLTQRLTRVWAAKPPSDPVLDLSYSYDAAGNIDTATDAVHDETASYLYDHLDRLIYADISDLTGITETRTYSYDELGNMLQFRLAYPAMGAWNGAFTPGAATLTSDDGGSPPTTIHTGRAAFGSLGPAPYVTEFGPQQVPPIPGQQTRGDFNGGVASSSDGTGTTGRGGFSSYSTSSGVSQAILSFVRGFIGDMAPNPATVYTGPNGSETTDYTYGENGAGPHAVTSLSDGSTFTYDANGNMIQRYDGPSTTTWTYTFDARNMLTEVSDGTTTTTYLYDAGGARVSRSVDNGTTITKMLYIAGMEITLVDGSETKRKTFLPGGAFRIVGGSDAGLYFSHSDHLGSTSAMTDSNGDLVPDSDVQYAPFGETRNNTELPDLTDFGYTGQILDRSSGGLMYYNARYYLPKLRRFVSADTIVPSLMNSQDLNRYSYTENNPINYIDPSGHEPEEYSDEWWVARYYALELWKYEDPGVNEVTNAAVAAAITSVSYDYHALLEEFGITVITDADEETALSQYVTIFAAVLAIARRMSSLVEGYGNSFADSASLFKEIFGDSHIITISEFISDNCDNNNCNLGDLSSGANIYLWADDLERLGSNLVIHEFAHTFTNTDNREAFSFSFLKTDEGYTFADPRGYPTNSEVTRWWNSNKDKLTRITSSTAESEYSADAFLNWVLGVDLAELNYYGASIVEYCMAQGYACGY